MADINTVQIANVIKIDTNRRSKYSEYFIMDSYPRAKFSINQEINELKVINYATRKVGRRNVYGYIVKCSKCNKTSFLFGDRLKRKVRCPKCALHRFIEGRDDVFPSHKEYLPYFVNIEDAKKVSVSSSLKFMAKCPDCGTQKMASMRNIHFDGFKCAICSDGISFPEKFMSSLLSQLKVNVTRQLSSKTFNWCGIYRYDFYDNDKNIIIEVHGDQHYRNVPSWNIMTEDQIFTDKEKENLALENGITDYIVINCSKSASDLARSLNVPIDDIHGVIKQITRGKVNYYYDKKYPNLDLYSIEILERSYKRK